MDLRGTTCRMVRRPCPEPPPSGHGRGRRYARRGAMRPPLRFALLGASLTLLVATCGTVGAEQPRHRGPRAAAAAILAKAEADDLRRLCNGDCGLIDNADLRRYCRGDCGLIDN